MVLKPLKIKPPGMFYLIILQPDRLSKNNLYDPFLTKWRQMLKMCKHLKMSQVEQFFMFSISALPPEGAFQMFTHF